MFFDKTELGKENQNTAQKELDNLIDLNNRRLISTAEDAQSYTWVKYIFPLGKHLLNLETMKKEKA